MRRREFIALLGGAAAWPLTARAQPTDKIVRIGFFGLDRIVPIGAASYQAFVDEMKIHGFINDQNLVVDFRRLEQDSAGLSSDMAELVQLNVNALVTQGTEPALKAAIGATRTVPIVMIATNFDPFAGGYVKSLARPGGNVTGLFLRQTELAEKQTELLLEAVPDKKRVGILCHLISTAQFSAAERRAKAFGLEVNSLKLENPPYDFDAAFRSMPIALAVFRFTTNSNRFGCSIGISAGLVPLRIFTTWVAACRCIAI
jgi:putative ABC transport system substrate-binding protein